MDDPPAGTGAAAGGTMVEGVVVAVCCELLVEVGAAAEDRVVGTELVAGTRLVGLGAVLVTTGLGVDAFTVGLGADRVVVPAGVVPATRTALFVRVDRTAGAGGFTDEFRGAAERRAGLCVFAVWVDAAGGFGAARAMVAPTEASPAAPAIPAVNILTRRRIVEWSSFQ